MAGIRDNDGQAMALVSDHLWHATITMQNPEVDWGCDPLLRGRIVRSPEYELTTSMKRFQIAKAETYSEAMARVMGLWSPDCRHVGIRRLTEG